MPLTSLTMPCGFEESLVDFETAIAYNQDDWVVSDFDSEALGALVRESNKEDTTDSKSTSECSSSTSSWCRSSSRQSLSGMTSNFGSSSYCRRLSLNPRRSSSFQLWSPRLRLRDERKRVLKLSLAKLRRIDDPESCLRRSVLLNNTLRRLQREAREEKMSEPRARLEEFCSRNEPQVRTPVSRQVWPTTPGGPSPTCNGVVASPPPVHSPSAVHEETSSPTELTEAPRAGIKRRRPSDVRDEESPVDHGGLNFNDLYLPPTPRMIPSLEDEEETRRTMDSSACKKSKSVEGKETSRSRPALRPCNSLPSVTNTSSATTTTSTGQTTPVSGYTCLTSGLSGLVTSSSMFDVDKQYSCGQSSLFGELQSVVFHSLITSLES